MLDMNTPLGRDVPTAQQVLEVIRPHLRCALYTRNGEKAAIRAGWLASDEDLNPSDGGDLSVGNAIFLALINDAMVNVKQWAKDMKLVFDEERTREFVRVALIEALSDALPDGAMEY